MLNLLMFFIGITFIFLIARYNKSNKLFWILLMAMMSGFIGGTIANSFTDDEKQVNITISTDDGTTASIPYLFKPELPVYSFDEPEKEIVNLYENIDYVNLYVSQSKSGTFKPRQNPDYIDTS